jgi:hypothetical protein
MLNNRSFLPCKAKAKSLRTYFKQENPNYFYKWSANRLRTRPNPEDNPLQLDLNHDNVRHVFYNSLPLSHTRGEPKMSFVGPGGGSNQNPNERKLKYQRSSQSQKLPGLRSAAKAC